MLEDALKQATETAKKGKEGVWSADTYVRAPLHSDTNSYFDFKLESDMVEDRLRHHFDYYLGKTEIVIYSVLAVLLAVTALCHRNRGPNTVDRSQSLDGCSPDSEGTEPTPHCADAGGDSAYSTYLHSLPCSGYRTLSDRRTDCLNSPRFVITLEAATLTKEGAWATEGSSAIFHSSMIELGLLGLLVLVLVVSIILRRCSRIERLVGTLKSDSSSPRMPKDAPIYSQVQRFCPDGRQPETGF